MPFKPTVTSVPVPSSSQMRMDNENHVDHTHPFPARRCEPPSTPSDHSTCFYLGLWIKPNIRETIHRFLKVVALLRKPFELNHSPLTHPYIIWLEFCVDRLGLL